MRTFPILGFQQLGRGSFGDGVMPGSVNSNTMKYWEKVVSRFGSALIGYYPMAETLGTTLIDQSGVAGNGAYSANIQLNNAPGIGDGKNAPLFSTSYANFLTAAFNTALNPAEFTVWIWAKALNAGIWTDNAKRYITMIFADNGNLFEIFKETNNLVYLRAYSGGVGVSVNGSITSTGWMMFALTFSKSANQMKAYYNGAQMGTTQTTGGVWNGPALVKALFGGYNTTPAFPWSGWMAQGAVLNRAATLAEIQSLYNLNP